jgi:membrane protease YdiL (CAAX protease family)
MKERLSKIRDYQLPLFFTIAFVITWTAQITVYLYAYNHNLKISNEMLFFHFRDLLRGNIIAEFAPYLLLFIFSFGPTIAGILVTILFKGRDGINDLFTRLVKIRIPRRWVMLILAVPIAWNVICLVLGYAIAGFQPVEFDFLVPVASFAPFLLFMVVFTGLSEEIGWRGYALPELQTKFTAEKSSWILGVMWGLWHIPSVLLTPFLQNELNTVSVVSLLAGLTFGIIGWTIVITWIYNNTQSLFWIIVLHGLSNTIQSYLLLSSNNQPAMSIWIILPWALAIFLLKKFGGKTLLTTPIVKLQ